MKFYNFVEFIILKYLNYLVSRVLIIYSIEGANKHLFKVYVFIWNNDKLSICNISWFMAFMQF